ncbi:hypothetical protein ACROYT_G029535 [Oculina patagonica]
MVLLYIWAQALVVALFPVFGWSRYVYLSYEFICTVQWEYNIPYTIFLCVTCFVTPLIVTFMCYASVMKVACHQARERPTTTVGEIEAEHSYMATYNQTNDKQDVKNLAVIDEKQIGNGHCHNSLKAPTSNNRDMVVTAEINTQIDSRKKEQEKAKNDFLNGSNQEPDVSGPSDAKGQAIISNKSTRPEHILKRSTNVTRMWDERAMFRENPAKFTESNTQTKKVKLSVITERNVTINPAGAMSRINPAHSRSKSAWTRKGSFESKLGIISDENETQDLQESPISSIKARTASVGYLARMKEWMAVRLMNKEKTGAILERKKDMKVVLTLLVVNGTFVLCWLPHFIGITCLTFTNGSCPFPDSFFTITTTLAMLNSGCNPFIYTLTYRKFRKAFKKVFPWLRFNRIGNINSSAD